MSNKSGVSEQVISLPKGGGALKGIGEKFSPDLHTGTGNFTVPVSLPPGRNGFQPDLALTYSTGNGNGPFGLGWALSIPGVSLKTSEGIPRYQGEDVYILSGAEDLVLVKDETVGSGTQQEERRRQYRPRTEGLFARIVHVTGADEDRWEVTSKSGVTSIYGKDAGSRLHDEERPDCIFQWMLSETVDTFGNRILYTYQREDEAGLEGQRYEANHAYNQIYLSKIRYADYSSGGDPSDKFLYSVEFDHGEYDEDGNPNGVWAYRPDPFSTYRAGFEIRTIRRCRRILVKVHEEDGPTGGSLTKSYRLRYLDELSESERGPKPLPTNGASLLAEVTVAGHLVDPAEGSAVESLPPLAFGYTRFEPKKRKFESLQGASLPSTSLANPGLELADVTGDGLPDMVEMNGTVRYWRNLGEGRYDRPREMRTAPAGFSLADPGVQMIDANGDGSVDLLVTTNGHVGYYPLRFGDMWDESSFHPYEEAPSFNLEDPEAKLVDLTGDGVSDVIRSGSRFECFFNDANGRRKGWTRENTRRVGRRSLQEFPNVNFSDPRVKWADMTGDGLQDIVLLHDRKVDYWPNLGHGDWGRRVSMHDCPRFPYGYDPRRILVGDIDGDGCADIVYVEDYKLTLWINQSGNGWSGAVPIMGTPSVSDADAVRLVDMLGTGVGGVLWSADANGLSRKHMFFLDFTGGTKPYLLSEMDNRMGAVTKVGYAPSTRFYLEDQERPETRWNTPLPFPVQVVDRVEVIDDISKGKLTTEYRYHHGYWDGAEREFRGFGMVEQLDTEAFGDYEGSGLHGDETPFAKVEQNFSPPTLTKTWFHQGPIGDEFGEWEETDFRAEFWQEDVPLLSRPASMDGFLKQLPRRAKRGALRALRGRVLRKELLALDGSKREDRPYTVEEYLYGVCEVLDGGDGHALVCEPRPEDPPENKGEEVPLRVFFPHALAQRSTQWERGNDPMSRFTFTDQYDEYGQPRQQTSVALPRREEKRQKIVGAVVAEIAGDLVNETRVLATHTRTEYAVPDSDLYMHDRTAQVHTLELDDPPGVPESESADLAQILKEGAAAAESVHQAFGALLEEWEPGLSLPLEVSLVGHTLNHYDGDDSRAFEGRNAGEVGPFGALIRSEALVSTDKVLDEAYKDTPANRRPTYLGGTTAPPAGAPSGFGDKLGYRLEEWDDASGHRKRWYASTQRQQYDFQTANPKQRRGLAVATRDALGHHLDIVPDKYWLLPELVTDPVDLETRAEYDYHVLQPVKVTDANENATRHVYTPLGLLWKVVLEGRAGEGGTEDRPEIEYSYDLMAYERTRTQPEPLPISVHTRRRVQHASDGASDEVIESREYSDGFGRLLQTRTQAEELAFGETGDDVGLATEPGGVRGPATGHRVAERVVVSGWQTYDNKGRVVEKYEPFFSQGWDYAPPTDAQLGQKATMFYDPRGLLVRTVNPDGSEQRALFGTLAELEDLENYSPSPWENYAYDANDLAPLSRRPDGESLADTAPLAHHFTPTSTVVDALGRSICQVERNGQDPAHDWFVTRSRYDTRGNLLTVFDALGRPAFEHAYDLLNRSLRVKSIDAGLRTSVLDAAGNLVEQRDSKGSAVLREYDDLNRLTHLWARDDEDAPLTLREKLVYGDDQQNSEMDREMAKESNLLSRLFKHYDEAGLQRFERYDFEGNLEEKVRQVVSDAALAEGWIANWSTADAGDALDESLYRTSTRYDALGRSVEIVYPEGVNGQRSTLKPEYNRAGALERVDLDGKPYVSQIAYNAMGQRVLVAYGNDVMTRYAYDEHTFRLKRLRSERYEDPPTNPDTWSGKGAAIQELTYAFDLAGNISSIEDRAPGCGITGSSEGRHRLVRRFEYDPLYRLTKAGGRACKSIAAPRPFGDLPRCGGYSPPYDPGLAVPNQNNAPDVTRRYTEAYTYNPAGNLLKLKHVAGDQWTRTFGVAEDSNRLERVTTGRGSPANTFEYDENGNMVRQHTNREYAWNHADRMTAFANRPVGSTHSSVEARYLYGGDGTRVKKWVRTNGSGDGESTVYVDGVFEHHGWKKPNRPYKQNNCLHVMDGRSRVALVRRGDDNEEDAGPPVQYHLGDHLGTSSVVTSDAGAWVNREEYFPYGETSFGSFARKRYRFTGKERDEESGLYYHGARHYAPWLARWGSCDPAGMVDGFNLYAFVRNNPVRFSDGTGRQAQEGHSIGSYIPLTGAGGSAAQFYADLVVEGEKQGGFTGFMQQVGGWTGGVFASLWTEETAVSTAVTLGTAGLGAAAQAGRLGAASVPVAKTLAVAGSFQSGVSVTEAATGTSITGSELSTSERVMRGVTGAFGLASIGVAARPIPTRSTPSSTLPQGGSATPTNTPPSVGATSRTSSADYYATVTGESVPTVSPGGRPITAHAAEQMASPPTGRRVSTPEEADILAKTGTFRKAELNPETLDLRTVQLQRGDLPGKPSVVISADDAQRIVTTIVPVKTPPITQ